MRTHNIAIRLFALLLFCSPLFLFGQRPDHRPPQHDLEQLQTELNLTDEQVTQLKALEEEHRATMQQFREGGERPDPSTMKAQREAHRKSMEGILTPEQMDKFKELQKEKRSERQGRHSEMKGQREQVRAEIEPLMLAQRQKFETVLSTEDKARLAELRVEAQALKAQRPERGHRGHQGQAGMTEAQRAEREALRAQKEALHQELLPIAERYRSDLERLHEEIKPELEAIRAKYAPEGAPAPAGRHGKQRSCEGKAECKGKGQANRLGEGPGHRGQMAARFLLMDPAGTVMTTEAAAPELDVYPNPSTGLQTLHYTVPVAGAVRVELIARDGTVQRVLWEGRQAVGEHDLKVDTQGLRSEVYYYKVTTPTGETTQQFTVVK